MSHNQKMSHKIDGVIEKDLRNLLFEVTMSSLLEHPIDSGVFFKNFIKRNSSYNRKLPRLVERATQTQDIEVEVEIEINIHN